MIWLIGNKGMLGSDVERLLTSRKLNFVVSDKEVDICNADQLKKFIEAKKINWIINCSAYTAVDRAEGEMELAYKINSDGVLNITNVAREIGAKLIHLSTDYVFDGNKAAEYFENDVPNPLGIYGKSKVQGEKNIRNNFEKHFIIRTAWLYGKNGNNFVCSMIKLFNEKDVVKVVNDQCGSPTFTKDLAKFILNIVVSNSVKYGIYNFTNDGATTWYEFACKIYEFAKEYGLVENDVSIVPISTKDYPTRAIRPKNSCLSKNKMLDTFGFKNRSWNSALDEFIKSLT
ncbi:MAG: dTDP-4-dehydrorhamnose reductase [Pseudomonadota bacterium]